MKRTCAIIPTYNEGKYIGSVIERVAKHNVDIIVIDDGSTDGTEDLLKTLDITFLKHRVNTGKGTALLDGFKIARERGYDYIVTMDADNQHDPDELPRFIDKISSGWADIVIGDRMHDTGNMPFKKKFCNICASKIVSAVCRQYIPDALSGYRAFSKEVLNAIEPSCERFDIVPEILIKASKKRFVIKYIGIESIYADEISHIRSRRDGPMFWGLIFRELFSK